MASMQNPNLEILRYTVDRLGALADEMVFVGGCATGLLITDAAAPPVRVTKDVDAIVQVASQVEYYQLSEKLRASGFREDASEDAPVCRWLIDHVILDVMPTDERILGFGNKWYRAACDHVVNVSLPAGGFIRMVSAPYFLATKLEAFEGRGRGDFQMSHDLEDIIAVVDGRPQIIEEVKQSDAVLMHELTSQFKKLLANRKFVDAIPGHMPPDMASQARCLIVLKRLGEIAELKMGFE